MVVHLWGKYWMAAWRGGRAPRVGHRRGDLPGGRARGAHRLRLPAELRRAVDLHAGQGRTQLGRGRRVLQRHQLRPDVQLPHPAAADSGRAARERARPARAPQRRRAAVRAREEAGGRAGPRVPVATAPPRPRAGRSHELPAPQGRHPALEGPLPALRPDQRAVHRRRRHHAAGGAADRSCSPRPTTSPARSPSGRTNCRPTSSPRRRRSSTEPATPPNTALPTTTTAKASTRRSCTRRNGSASAIRSTRRTTS